MANPVEFGSFYKLLRSVRDGSDEKSKELEWMLAEYEHAKDATSAYDELGQIFCHHGVMELYDYTGTDNIKYINTLDKSVWNYLEVRMNIGLEDYMVKSMLTHAKDHQLAKKVSEKWKSNLNEIESNIKDLAKYVTDGIVELII
ncbi:MULTISPECIES: hypothetical protein [Prochlorococcus]|uniref:Uncharacterized protein n=1 Tax=Prochlorococcus marinus (strain SARG / CCMP1375 / SS120) TaxID=167539 RepID=Q7VB99_PROMA|nr:MULTISPECIES: hypothetical protein [Prochlorococcus]AAQ00243.1 Predicted protein family PM-8 [Prochlorococcus marinus subsp. marinus str. CCMP1375]KGG14045.1 hypothetical protein EV04_0530 [Prochlorococcus marinus str. LG]KGG19178.1 hypothetical protein EV08_1665 [Prochlorococcus marinus str. SS2]KGG23282.1 hypothetical protein EV09_0906 [Prochlorococcus marinus str. SS35]KGG32483.1 hypothetical protein EV10_1598 [Prochlorococcus marinus str. SS51]